MSQIDLESDGDTSDEDYVPGGADCAQLSEVESDGDPEDDVNSEDESSNKHRKRKSKTKSKKAKRTKTIVEEEEVEDEPEPKKLNEEDQKKKTDSLWADFLKDTDFKPKPKPTVTDKQPAAKSPTVETKTEKEKPKAPIIFEFAGETVSIPDKSGPTNSQGSSQLPSSTSTVKLPPVRARGGMSSVLSQLGKKQKITTLEKSKLDWDQFKEAENISDELRAFNKGKNGYLERQDFLQRADSRQFELEKQARAVARSHRS